MVDIQIYEDKKGGTLSEGVTEIPFEFKLQKTGNQPLIETYHGVFVNISYKIHLHITRGYFAKEIKKVFLFL